MNNNDVFIVSHISPGTKAKLARVALNLRQVDIACKANVSVEDVVCLEKDRIMPPGKARKIFSALGIDANEA